MKKQNLFKLLLLNTIGLLGGNNLLSQPLDTLKTSNNRYVHESARFGAGYVFDFNIYVRKEIKYPISIYWTRHNKQVIIQFIVTNKQKVDSVVFLQSSGINKLDMEIVKVMTNSKGWSSAKCNGEPVDQQCEITIIIR